MKNRSVVSALLLLLAVIVGSAASASADPWYKHYEEAEKALEAEKWTKAIEQINEAIERKGDSGARVRSYGMKIISYFPHLKLGIAYYQLGQFDAALQAFETEERLEAIARSEGALRELETFRDLAEKGCLGAQLAISVHNCPVLADTRFPMSIFKRTQRKYVKKAYRVRNWREYEAGLRNRGSLTVWISLTAGKLVNWDAPRPRRRKPGRQDKYSNHAIETAVTLGMVFHLSSRQSEGLLRSLFALMKLDNDVPDHTTISRRKPKLGKVPFYQVKQKTPLHILIDSSGLAVHAGQLRRAQKSRDYRKLHLCVDEQSGEVVAGELTSKRARDSSRVASLVGQIDSPISSARADTAYDAGGVYEAIENHSAHRSPRVLIPPRKGALLASGPASSRQRNRNIAAQARLGKRKWHTESGYSKRSKVETTFHRYKAIVGSAMRARGLAAQRVEARIGCKILNTMTALGMPDSEMTG